MSDPDRPYYHVHALPEEGVCCPYDPNGAIRWNGRCHLMYIYQDPSLPHGGHCWGHLSSADLIGWTVHPPALVPGPGDPDRGIFSGNAFVNREGVPTLCWFGIDAGVCVATAEDAGLLRWRKHPANPVIPIPKEGDPGHNVYTVWDPYLWLDGDVYRCLLGGNRLPNGKDTLYAMRSRDLVRWDPVGPFYEHPDLTWTEDDEDCSCPDFFALDGKHVLLCISHKIGARCTIGRYEGERFHPERHVRMNWPGGMFFAPESLLDDRGRRIVWAWVTDPRVGPSQRKTGSGTMSLPRVLSLDAGGTLLVEPAEEIASLRRARHRIDRVPLPAGAEVPFDGNPLPAGAEKPYDGVPLPAGTEAPFGGIRGDRLEIAVEIDAGSAREVGLKVRRSPDGVEETAIGIDVDAGTLWVDTSRSTLRDDVTYGQPPFAAYGVQSAAENRTPYSRVTAPFEIRTGETLRMRVFLDGPMVEVFANGRQCVTQQVFPAREDSVGTSAFARGGGAAIRSIEAWEMAPITITDERPDA